MYEYTDNENEIRGILGRVIHVLREQAAEIQFRIAEDSWISNTWLEGNEIVVRAEDIPWDEPRRIKSAKFYPGGRPQGRETPARFSVVARRFQAEVEFANHNCAIKVRLVVGGHDESYTVGIDGISKPFGPRSKSDLVLFANEAELTARIVESIDQLFTAHKAERRLLVDNEHY